MHSLEIILAVLAVALNAKCAGNSRRVWIALSIWTTLSLSTAAADATGIHRWVPGVEWFRAVGVFWFLLSIPVSGSFRLLTKARYNTADRRYFLAAGASLALAPAAAVAFSIRKSQSEAVIREVQMALPRVERDLQGLRLVQISDIHLSPFYSRDHLRRVVDQANGLNPDLVLITGDLITSYTDPLHDAIAELSRLRSTAGIFGCLGNHEILAEAEDEATRAGACAGIRFLRGEAETLRFGSARLRLAGVDYQPKNHPYLVGADSLQESGALNVLLSHNPDVFPVAVAQGWDLTLAGHTHGGQVTLEYLHPSLNPARFYTPFTYGLYKQQGKAMFVTSGLGTVGIPARLGVSPEIALIRVGSKTGA